MGKRGGIPWLHHLYETICIEMQFGSGYPVGEGVIFLSVIF